MSRQLLEKGDVDEKNHVQPRSFLLCQALYQELLPDIFEELQFCRKGCNDGVDYTQYSTTLMADQTELRVVVGEADIAVVYHHHCIFVWEDKAVGESLKGFKHQSQILAEVKAMGQHLHESFGEYPIMFSGILTNGIDFSAAQMSGNFKKFRLSQPLEGEKFHHLLAHSVCESGKLVQFINAKDKETTEQTLSMKRGAGDSDNNDDEDDPYVDNQDDNDKPPRKRIARQGAAGVTGARAGGGVASSSSSSAALSGKKPRGKQNSHSHSGAT